MLLHAAVPHSINLNVITMYTYQQHIIHHLYPPAAQPHSATRQGSTGFFPLLDNARITRFRASMQLDCELPLGFCRNPAPSNHACVQGLGEAKDLNARQSHKPFNSLNKAGACQGA